MGLKWFVQINDVVEGPLSTEDVQSRVQSGQLSSHGLIWGQGMETWQKLDWWSRELPKFKSNKQTESLNDSWHYAANGKSHGPFSRELLILQLKHLENLNEVLLWTKGMKEWAPMFEFHDILSDVGVNKRQFPRAELRGQAVLKCDGLTLVATMVSISESGCSVKVEADLVPGQMVNIEMQCPVFNDVLSAKAECRHTSAGILGLKFLQISAAHKATIVQFVKKSQTRFVLKAA